MRSLDVLDSESLGSFAHVVGLALPSAFNDAREIEERQVGHLLTDDGNVQHIIDHASDICASVHSYNVCVSHSVIHEPISRLRRVTTDLRCDV